MPRDVGLRVAHVAGARGPVVGSTCAPGSTAASSKRSFSEIAAGGDVDHLAADAGRLGGAQHAVDDVGDVGEVARLLAVAVDGRALALEQAP